MTTKGKAPEVFKIGDRVTNLAGNWKGTIIRIGPFGKTAHVKWDNNQQEMLHLSELIREM